MFVEQSVPTHVEVNEKCWFSVRIAADRSPVLDLIVVGLAVRFEAVCVEPRGLGMRAQAVPKTNTDTIDRHDNLLCKSKLVGRAHNEGLVSTQWLEGGIARFRLPRPCRSGARRFGSRRRLDRSALRLHIVGVRGWVQTFLRIHCEMPTSARMCKFDEAGHVREY